MANAIFIVGYYRSGTSALSGALQRTGVKFYNEADPNEHNPLGFYEIPELIEFDANLFSHLGVDWPDVRGLPDGWEDRTDVAPFATQLEEILRRRFLPEDSLWGLKHPHLCRTLPLYEKVARRAGHTPHVIHIFRDPWIAASSQCYKNGLSRAHALLLWLTYATNAERQARHLPRTWLTYHDLLAEPAQQLQRIGAELGLTLRGEKGDNLAEACAYLTGQLDRSKPLSHDLLCRPLEVLVNRTWEAIQAKQFAPELWDELAAETSDLVAFLEEIGTSKARALPTFGSTAAQVGSGLAATRQPRPAERTDEGAKRRLTNLLGTTSQLPRVAVLIVAPAGRAHAVAESMESLRKQWHAPAFIKVLTVDTLALEDVPVVTAPAGAEAITRALCAEFGQQAGVADYVAILNAGDTVSPDACLRFTLLAAETKADMIYSDEIVPNNDNSWIRYKPGWDVTRLRQAAYIGDWVWYGCKALEAAGGLNPDMAGAEEYDLQLRLAAQNARVERLPEAVFIRSGQSKRDDIASTIFCARAVSALSQHLTLAGMKAEVQNRQYPGLFYHMRLVEDPGTTVIMLCDGGEIPTIDKWLTALLTGKPMTGPIILAGAVLSEQMQTYLTAVAEQQDVLQGKVLAVIAPTSGEAIAKALALATTAHVAFLDARLQDVSPYWQEQLRARLADEGVVAVAARTITPVGTDGRQGQIMGPIILGADTRLGAGHGPLDPGPGGWLVVDQEASALAPPGLLVRREALARCQVSTTLTGDALWIDLCAQLRAEGGRLVWTPDVSFIMPAVIDVDAQSTFRTGSPAARALPWADPYHHPALSLHGDLLVAEKDIGLVRSTPYDPSTLLLTGDVSAEDATLNAARALRLDGVLDAGWAPGSPTEADLMRCTPNGWVRINPSQPPSTTAIAHMAVFNTQPTAEALPALTSAAAIFATSPGLVKHLRGHAPNRIPVELWRPALSSKIWQNFKPAAGLNTKPRILFIEEGFSPPWFHELVLETVNLVSWIIVQPLSGTTYADGVTILSRPMNEQSWADLLSAVAPQVLLRPANADTYADCYSTLLAAAAGCRLIIDSRLDAPESLKPLRLPNQKQSWMTALAEAVTNLATTLQHGAQTRAAALALPTLEQAPPSWASLTRFANLTPR